jgi:hypothetical protein
MLKKLFSLSGLLNDWKSGTYQHLNTRYYIMVFILTNSVSGIFPTNTGSNSIGFGGRALVILITSSLVFWLLNILWSDNGGNRGNNFLDKWVSLSTVYTITRLLPVLALVTGGGILAMSAMPSSANLISVFVLVGFLGGLLVYFLNMRKYFEEIRDAEISRYNPPYV